MASVGALRTFGAPAPLNLFVRPLMKPSTEFIVYMVGVALAGAFYERLKSFVSSEPLFFGLFLAYLLALRLVAASIKRLLDRRG